MYIIIIIIIHELLDHFYERIVGTYHAAGGLGLGVEGSGFSRRTQTRLRIPPTPAPTCSLFYFQILIVTSSVII